MFIDVYGDICNRWLVGYGRETGRPLTKLAMDNTVHLGCAPSMWVLWLWTSEAMVDATVDVS